MSSGRFADCRYWFELARAMTRRPGKVASLPRTSSVMPSAKYASSGRPKFSNGSTANRTGLAAAASAPGGVPTSAPASDAGCVRRHANTPPALTAIANASASKAAGDTRRRRSAGVAAGPSACANAAAVGKRSAGLLARARARADRTCGGTPSRSTPTSGAGVAKRLAMTACGVAPVKGGSPASIS
jgi:hypothetical protein